MKDGRKVAIYARVSTDEQRPEVQLRELRPLALARGREVLEFVDKGVSGAKASRPALDALLVRARAGELEALVVWKLDRLGRSLKNLVLLLDELRERGVAFVSKTEAFDTSTPLGRAMLQLVAVLAELERENIRDRVKAGLALARERGVRLGRPERGTREQLERARSLRAEGKSWREIAQAVGLPASTVRNKLRVAVCNKPTKKRPSKKRKKRGSG